MPRLRITIIDIISNKPTKRWYSRMMNPNFANIMPQVIAVWCEQAGHDVRFVTYTGVEDFSNELVNDTDMVFISAFSASALLAYAIGNMYRQRGAVTVLGGPHARCYPEDAVRFFDYVIGLTDKSLITDLLKYAEQRRGPGVSLQAQQQIRELPGVKQRWKFIAPTLAKTPLLKLIPMIGSTGCPYTCSFCIDSVISYQSLGYEQMREDLQFVQTQFKHPRVGWHDPNFGVRFDEYLNVIEEVVPSGRIDFVAESSLSLLSENRLQRLRKNGFKALLPGIESWYDLGNKSKTGKQEGMQKVEQISAHVNTILRYIPYVQTNFILGLDCDEGPEPFELTKRFMQMTPGAYPAFSLFTAYGRAAPLNLELQRAGRVLPVPFHFLNSTRGMNIKPKNYDWAEFYAYVHDLTAFAHSWEQVRRRFSAGHGMLPKAISALRGATTKKVRYYALMESMMRNDSAFRAYFEGTSTVLPTFFRERIRADLGPFWAHLPEGALEHAACAYLDDHNAAQAEHDQHTNIAAAGVPLTVTA